MHGLGDSADSFVSVFQQFPVKSFKFVLLNAPQSAVTINGGAVMPSWYDILDFNRTEKSISQKDVESSSLKILQYVHEEAKAKEISEDYKRIFLGGFSQGGFMSLYTGLSSEKNFGGLVSLSGGLFPFTKIQSDKKDIPIFLAHGTYDMMVPYKIAEESYEILLNKKTKVDQSEKFKNVEFHSYDIDHTLNYEELQKLQDFLSRC